MEAPHGFRHLGIDASLRSLGKLKRGLIARVKGGDIPLLVHDHRFNHISRTFVKGKGLNIQLSPEELHHNHASGIFGKKADKAFKKAGIKKAVYKVGAALKPLAQESLALGTQMGAAALSAYAPEFAPEINAGASWINKKGQQYIEDPEAQQASWKKKVAAAKKDPATAVAKTLGHATAADLQAHLIGAASDATGHDIAAYHQMYQEAKSGRPGALQEHLIKQASDATGHDIKGYMDMYQEAKNAPPSRQPLTDAFNAYTGADIGRLDKAAVGDYAANLGMSKLNDYVQQQRDKLARTQLDFSGGDSRFYLADAVPDEVVGQGLYGHGLYGHGVFHRGAPRRRREMSSVGIGGNLLGNPPALASQAAASNFQFGSRLGPAFKMIRGQGLY